MREKTKNTCNDLIALSLVPGLGPRKIMALEEEGRIAGEAKHVKLSREFLEEVEYIKKEGMVKIEWNIITPLSFLMD